MTKPRDELIARKCFASLWLDYEWEDFVSCRVLIDGWFKANLYAKDCEEAIDKFMKGDYS